MKEYLQHLRQRFRNIAHLAEFVGVSPHTVKAWQLGKRTPDGVTLRMLQVLGLLATEAPELLSAMIGGKPAAKTRREVVLPPLAPLTRPIIPPTQRETSTAAREEKAYWLAQWDMPGVSEIDSLSDDEYERIGRLIGKLT